MTKVLIHSPYTERAGQGNSVTATRTERMLSELGYSVVHSQSDYSGESADVMIALNARKSAKAIARFCYLHPASSVIIVLTGTDINHLDVIDEKSSTWISMKLADRLVILHEASLKQVPEIFHEKTSVIYPSVTLPEGLLHKPDDRSSIIFAGNMRKEKNPELAYAAAEEVAPDLKIHHYGESDSTGSEHVIEHGAVSHDEMLSAMSAGHVLLNTSFQEGGANAVCEAVSMGLPVIASAIPGNIGMLGDDYAGTFPSNDLNALVSLLRKTADDPEFYTLLKRQTEARAPLFAPSRESASWQDLISGLSN